jgi:hypothetical protein
MTGKQGWNLRAAHRIGNVRYFERPACQNRTARYAWDHFALGGSIEWMELFDGKWKCKRPGRPIIEQADNIAFNRWEVKRRKAR